MKNYRSFLLEIFSGIAVNNPEVRQKLHDLLDKGQSSDFYNAYRDAVHAANGGKSPKPAKSTMKSREDEIFDPHHIKKAREEHEKIKKQLSKQTTKQINTEELDEAVYPNNIGFGEMFGYLSDKNVAQRDKERFHDHMQSGRLQRAYHMLRDHYAQKNNDPDFAFHPSVYPKPKI